LASNLIAVAGAATAGYYSLAERVRDKLHVNVSIAPAGLAWQQVHRMSIGSAATELPEGKLPNFLLSHISILKVILHTAQHIVI